MKKPIIIAGALSAILLLMFYCAESKYDNPFDNPLDKKGTNYLYGDTTHEQEKIGDINNNGISDLFDPKYTVTFNANGGTVSPASGTTRADGRLASLPTPARSGYTFDGWYTAETGGQRVTTGTNGTEFSTNNTIFAKWTDNSVTQTERYTITFDYKDTGVSNTILTTGTDGKLASLPETPTRSGYTFKGWWTTETTGGDNVTVDWVYNADATIYARWEEGVTQTTTFTIAFNVNGGNELTPNTGTTGTDGKLASLPEPTRNGYTFNGWYMAETGGSHVTTGTTFYADATVYAQWAVIIIQPVTYTLTVECNPVGGGLTIPWPSEENISGGTQVNIRANAASDYIFVNWTVISGSATIANPNSDATTVTLSSDATIRANFQKDNTPPSGNTFTDSRDGKRYKTVTIGGQTWMAENLNYDGKENGSEKGVCYGNSAENCAKYGRLYNWSTAMGGASSSNLSPSGVQGVCPNGWHLPSDAEWTTLTDFVGSNAGTKLKATSGWYNNGNGSDDYGFSALPGGYGSSDGSFYGAGYYGNWWSATESNADYAWCRNMSYNYGYVVRFNNYETILYSVRCAQD